MANEYSVISVMLYSLASALSGVDRAEKVIKLFRKPVHQSKLRKTSLLNGKLCVVGGLLPEVFGP
jgi:hypothetical protein